MTYGPPILGLQAAATWQGDGLEFLELVDGQRAPVGHNDDLAQGVARDDLLQRGLESLHLGGVAVEDR